MICRVFVGLSGLAALSLVPQPIAAQDNAKPHSETADAGNDEVMAQFEGMFPSEPLTSDQQARLPQAQRIVSRVFPDGTISEMMGGMMDGLIDSGIDLAGGPAITAVTRGTALRADTLRLSPEQADELAALFDPAYTERYKRQMALLPEFLRAMRVKMEPDMRKALAEIYAIQFSQVELDDIETFVKTDSGTAYARKSFIMAGDLRLIGASALAVLGIGAFEGLEDLMATAGKGLPAERDFHALSSTEQARVMALTGYDDAEIRERLFERADQ